MPPEPNEEYTWECKSQIDPAFVARKEAWAKEKRGWRVNAPSDEDTARAQWQAQYDFFYQYLRGEVERLRFNERADPIEIELYATAGGFMGQVQIGNRYLRAFGSKALDRHGGRILKIRITLED